MALSDLTNEITRDPSVFQGDESAEMKTLDHVMKLVEDTISEVKNQAVLCLGQLTKILRDSQQDFVIEKLIALFNGTDDELRDVAGLALKTVMTNIPDGVVGKACTKVGPRLLKQLQNPSTPPEAILEGLSILAILNTRAPDEITRLDPQPVAVFTQLLKHNRVAVRKRAIVTIAQFIPGSAPNVFNAVLKDYIMPSWGGSVPLDRRVTAVQLVGAIARTAPQKLGPVVGELLPGIFSAISKDDPELKESCLQTLESLVLRCPQEITPCLNQIINAGLEYIKYDPNYAADDEEDEDEEMEDADDDDDDDSGAADEYSDDEDTSYKIRRSSTKVLAAVIGTRPEMLSKIYQTVSPVLISRFGDREESVKVEVWATYIILLNQTGVYGGTTGGRDNDAVAGSKRKRQDENMDVEDSPLDLLRSQVAAMCKVLLKQLHSKSPASSSQAGFQLLIELITVLPGALSQHASNVLGCAKSVLSQSVANTTTTLHTTTLSFLALFFKTHPAGSFNTSVLSITPVLLTEATQKHPRVATEAFKAFSALLQAVSPVTSGDWALQIYKEAVNRLSRNDTDAEVRAAAEEVIGDLWVAATPIVSTQGGAEWEALRRSARPEGAVKVIKKVGGSNVVMDEAWTTQSVEWVLGIVRKSGRGGRAESFECLDVLVSKGTVPAPLVVEITNQLKSYLTIADIAVLAQALSTLSLLLKTYTKITCPIVEDGRSGFLGIIAELASSPLVMGVTLSAVEDFYGTLVAADPQITSHLIPGLMMRAERAGKDGSPSNVSKCIARILRSDPMDIAGTISELNKSIKARSTAKESQIVLSLLTLGEIGRTVDMSLQANVFSDVLQFYTSDSEAVRSAAAFASGNICIGNTHVFLPKIVNMIQTDATRRILALHAVKEVVSNCSHGQLEGVAEVVWTPLFQQSGNTDEGTRNVASASLGKLAAINPERYLGQLCAKLQDPSPAVKATVLSALRYTLIDISAEYDDQLSPLIPEFLSLMNDSNLAVQRLTLSTLNAAARNKPNLIQEHLQKLMPVLYAETALKQHLIKIVDMGPWKHRVDEGLEARKTAYETMYTLLETCLRKLDINEFLSHVLVGIGDEANEIKVLGYMMLFRLSQVAPTAVAQRLDEALPELEKTMKDVTVTKDTVKQDLERAAELQRSCLRAIAGLSKIRTAGASPGFDIFLTRLESGKWGAELKELRAGN